MSTVISYVLLLCYRSFKRSSSMIRKRQSLSSCLWTRRKVHWRNLRLSRSVYVLDAKRRLSESRRYGMGKTSLSWKGKSAKTLSKMITMGSDSASETKVVELPFKDVSVQQKTESACEAGSRAIKFKKKRQTTSKKRLPFIVNAPWKQRKKQNGFHRRSGRTFQGSTVERMEKPDNANAKRSISRKKKKKKCRVLGKKDRKHSPQPAVKEDDYPKYHVTFNRVLEAYRSLRKGRGFHASKRVIWRNRHRLIGANKDLCKVYGYRDENYWRIREKEYDVCEPQEEQENPHVDQICGEHPSNIAKVGPAHPPEEQEDPHLDQVWKEQPSNSGTDGAAHAPEDQEDPNLYQIGKE